MNQIVPAIRKPIDNELAKSKTAAILTSEKPVNPTKQGKRYEEKLTKGK